MDHGVVPVTRHAAAPEYWFARRFPPSDRRNAFAPVHWKGWAVSIAFVSALAVGGIAFAWLGASGQLIQGVAIFAAVALLSGACFIAVATTKGDQTRTVQDYRKAHGRV
jgi:hypothetical protein